MSAAVVEPNVVIKFVTAGVVAAVVRDIGCHDVKWTTTGGWECSCHVDDCSHVARVAALVESRTHSDDPTHRRSNKPLLPLPDSQLEQAVDDPLAPPPGQGDS
jgi:hypothetical protein